jgi:hypothetical protein
MLEAIIDITYFALFRVGIKIMNLYLIPVIRRHNVLFYYYK